ncbi:MAG: AmiS/UreI family transporter [Clostridia bacterium]|nr:AmiS/UreI family transporter [Clostridia bacterium]
MFEVSLILFGVTIFLNGFIPIYKWDKRNLGVINTIIGIVILIFSIQGIMVATVLGDRLLYFGTLLFGLTNLYLASGIFLNINCRSFGVFCMFCLISAFSLSCYYIWSGATLIGTLWLIWATLWAFAFIGFTADKDFMIGTYIMFLIQGAFALFGIGLLVLFKVILI